MSSIDEQVELVEHQAEWRQEFLREYRRLNDLVDSSEDLQHIGSTAITAMPARPIIDLMLGIESWPPPDMLARMLVGLGYEALGEADVPGRWYFRRRGGGNFNLHVVLRGGELWLRNLALRDYLNSNSGARARYAAAKRAALGTGAAKLLTYSSAKADAIEALLLEAVANATAGGPESVH